MSQVLRNQDVTVFGDGSQTRSFTYITDLVDGIIKLMLSSENDPVNIGNPVEMTIEQIAETIIKMTGSTSRLSTVRCPPTIPNSAGPTSLELARSLAGSRRCSSKKVSSRQSSTSERRWISSNLH